MSERKKIAKEKEYLNFFFSRLKYLTFLDQFLLHFLHRQRAACYAFLIRKCCIKKDQLAEYQM